MRITVRQPSGVYPTLMRLISWQAPHTAVTICLPGPSGKSCASAADAQLNSVHTRTGRSGLLIAVSPHPQSSEVHLRRRSGPVPPLAHVGSHLADQGGGGRDACSLSGSKL